MIYLPSVVQYSRQPCDIIDNDSFNYGDIKVRHIQTRVTKTLKFIGGPQFTGWHIRPGDICDYGKRRSKQVIVLQMGIKKATVKNKDGSQQYAGYDVLFPINPDPARENRWRELYDYFEDERDKYAGITQLDTSLGTVDIRDITGLNMLFHFGRTAMGQYVLGTVTLSVEGVQVVSENELKKTILHEIAHAMVPQENHSRVWKAVDRRLGGTGNVRAEESIEQYVDPVIKEGFRQWSGYSATERDDFRKDRINNDKSVQSLVNSLSIIVDVMPWYLENYPNMHLYRVRGEIGVENVVRSILWVMERQPSLMKTKFRVKWWGMLEDQIWNLLLHTKADDVIQGKSHTIDRTTLRRITDQIAKDVRRFRRLK